MLNALQHTWASPSQGQVVSPEMPQVILVLHFVIEETEVQQHSGFSRVTGLGTDKLS